MASFYWIKLYHAILDDPKMGLMTDELFAFTIKLFLVAGETDKEGELPPIEHIAWRLHITQEACNEKLHELKRNGIIQCNEDETLWLVTNFAERQEAVPGKERVRQFRKRQKEQEEEPEEEAENPPDDGVTNSYIDIDIDSDKDKDKDNGKKVSPLLPDTIYSELLFEKLSTEFRAKGRNVPKKFPTLACKKKFDTKAVDLGDNLEPAIERALQKGITSVSGVTDFIAKWSTNGRTTTKTYQSNNRQPVARASGPGEPCIPAADDAAQDSGLPG